MKKTIYKIEKDAGEIRVFEQVTGQCDNPRVYSGLKAKLIFWFIERFFNRL